MLDSEAQIVSALPLAATPSLARLIGRRNHRFGSHNRYRPLYSAEDEVCRAVLLRRRPGLDPLRVWMLARQRRSGKTRREFGVGHRANPGQSAVTPEDVAAELDVLASRVRRLSPPLASNPNCFHEERSEIAKDIADLVRRVAPRNRPLSGVAVDISDIRRGRILTTNQTVNGRRIMVQKRRAFAVYVGERPVKKQ